jgi:molybdenum cofactor cytidylyltransferase
METGVFAVILAAGTSSRMGRPKQLLDWGGIPLLQAVIQKVLNCPFSEVVAVIGYRAEEIRHSIRIEDERFRWVINPNYAVGQSTSLLAGLGSGKGCHSAMIFLGDLPLIEDKTIRQIADAGLSKLRLHEPSELLVVRPSFRGVPGHPVFFGNIRAMDWTHLKGDEGAKGLLCNIRNRTLLSVDDPGVVMDIDTPQAYESLRLLAFPSQGGGSRMSQE